MTRTASPLTIITGRPIADGWMNVRFSFGGQSFRAQALVFDVPSRFGIAQGRVSKMAVWRIDVVPGTQPLRTTSVEIFNFDRGLDFDRAPAGLIDALVNHLESRRVTA